MTSVILGALDSLRSAVSRIRAAIAAEDKVESMTESHENTLRMFECVTVSMQSFESQLAECKQSVQNLQASQQSQNQHKKSFADSRCIANLRTLGSDKSEFRAWNDKLINAMAQMLGPQWRKFMRNLDLELDRNRVVLTTEQLNSIEGAANLGDADYVNENLYYVLVEKSEGEAALRVNSGEPGQGLMAYQKIYL